MCIFLANVIYLKNLSFFLIEDIKVFICIIVKTIAKRLYLMKNIVSFVKPRVGLDSKPRKKLKKRLSAEFEITRKEGHFVFCVATHYKKICFNMYFISIFSVIPLLDDTCVFIRMISVF